jgi:hypothetical protein
MLHPLAVEDYKEAYAWYEDRQAGLGERFMKAVRFKIDEIAQHPESYGSRGRKVFREVRVDFFPYLIVYKILNARNKYLSVQSTTPKNIPGKNTGANSS